MPKDYISQQKEDKTPCKALHTAQRQKGQVRTQALGRVFLHSSSLAMLDGGGCQVKKAGLISGKEKGRSQNDTCPAVLFPSHRSTSILEFICPLDKHLISVLY